MRAVFAMGAAFLAVVTMAGQAEAKTAFQLWAQGRGTYVPSKERLYDYRDDLAGAGLFPQPAPPRYRYRHLQEEYGVVPGYSGY